MSPPATEDWHELRVEVPAGAVSAVSAALFRLGAAGVQEAYLPGEQPRPRQPWDTGPPAPKPRRRVLISWFDHPDKRAVESALPAEAVSPRWSPVAMHDWETSWKVGFEPIVISPTLTIAPPWSGIEGALLIEPGQGFGTGQHASTRGALTLMEPVLPGLETCLDVGCGSGILALLAAREGLTAWGIDVDEPAVREAAIQAERNGLRARFDTTPVHRVPGRFDLVAANLHAELLQRLAPAILARTGRYLVCAGILTDREDLVRQAFDPELRLHARLPDASGDWVALRYERTST